MAPRVCLWLAAPSIVVAAAGCSDGVATRTADALLPLPAVQVSAPGSYEVVPLYLQFDAEKAKASVSELPPQF